MFVCLFGLLVRRPREWLPEGRLPFYGGCLGCVRGWAKAASSCEPVGTMPDYRVYVGDREWSAGNAELWLDETETHHLVTVNRARVGEPVTAFDGAGREWLCRLAAGGERRRTRLVVESESRRPGPACRLVLGQAVPKGGVMDDIVRQATELGVAVVAPLETARVEWRLEAERAERKREKWRAVAIEAAKQCGNAWLPELRPTSGLAAFLGGVEAAGVELRLVASLAAGARSLAAVLREFREANGGRPPRSAAWLVGPEGDFTPEEAALATAAGWLPVSLGPLVLRCDTAAVCALGVLRCETEG